MKTSLWIVIALVSGIVGFLTGYSVSSYTGTRNIENPHARGVNVEQKGGEPSKTSSAESPAGYPAAKAPGPAGY